MIILSQMRRGGTLKSFTNKMEVKHVSCKY